VESYCYDLVVLEKLIGPKPINAINQTDIARLLAMPTAGPLASGG
jgi:hypothetical protein